MSFDKRYFRNNRDRDGDAFPLKYLILLDIIILPASYIYRLVWEGGAFLLNLSFSRQDLNKTLKSMLSGLKDSMQWALYSGGDYV